MWRTVIICWFRFLLLSEIRTSSPFQVTSKYEDYEEYVVEHEISTAQANDSASLSDRSSYTPPPECQTCTRAEKQYCLSSDFINDHCCCDQRYREEFGFIPHTCYLGTKLCKTKTQDCVEYMRLKVCCCKKYVLEKWTDKSSASNAFDVREVRLSLIVFIVVCFICIYKIHR